MKVISNTAITLDGRISTAHGTHRRFGSKNDLKRMSMIRNLSDAILVGGNCFRLWPYPLIPDKTFVKPRKKIWWNVVLSNTMRVPIMQKFLTDKRVKPLFFTSKKTVSKKFPCDVVQCKGRITPRFIVRELAKRGVHTLLIEGGGDLIYQFFKAGLIDEMHVTLCPKLIGRRYAPTICDGEGFQNPEIRNLRLVSSRRVNGEIFLKYKKT